MIYFVNCKRNLGCKKRSIMENIFELSENEKTLIRVLDKNITHIEIPNGITMIREYAFRGCSALQSIDIPNSVTNI